MLRWAAGFLTIFLAFYIEQTSHGFNASAALAGVVLGSGAGQLVGISRVCESSSPIPRCWSSSAWPRARALMCSRPPRFSLTASIICMATTSATNSLGKVCLDSIIQRTGAERRRSRVFARSETVLQLAWVFGAAAALLAPSDRGRSVLGGSSVLLGIGAVVVTGRARSAARRPPAKELGDVGRVSRLSLVSAATGPRWGRLDIDSRGQGRFYRLADWTRGHTMRIEQFTDRVVVGVSGSVANLAALHAAVTLARDLDIPLVAVLAWAPAGGELAYHRAPCPLLLRVWERAAWDRLRTAFDDAFGGLLDDGDIEQIVVRCGPGPALVQLADRPTDLLVVGVARSRWRWRGAVTRYCLRHARCSTLAVAPPPLIHDLHHHRWVDEELAAALGHSAG